MMLASNPVVVRRTSAGCAMRAMSGRTKAWRRLGHRVRSRARVTSRCLSCGWWSPTICDRERALQPRLRGRATRQRSGGRCPSRCRSIAGRAAGAVSLAELSKGLHARCAGDPRWQLERLPPKLRTFPTSSSGPGAAFPNALAPRPLYPRELPTCCTAQVGELGPNPVVRSRASFRLTDARQFDRTTRQNLCRGTIGRASRPPATRR